MIDPVKIKAAVKSGEITFHVKDGIVYCTDKLTGDTTQIGSIERKQAKHIPPTTNNLITHAFDFECPTCGRYLELPDHYCSYCGQPLKYE